MTEQTTQPLFKAVIDCPHTIDRDSITLRFNPNQVGHNALNQLLRRLQPLETQLTARRGTGAQIEHERKLTCEAIEGAIAFGYGGINAPPNDDHWLARFWRHGANLRLHEQRGSSAGLCVAKALVREVQGSWDTGADFPYAQGERAIVESTCDALIERIDEAIVDIAQQPTAASALTEDQRQRVCDAVSESLGEAYDCLRTWGAWGVGTMGPDDFRLVSEDAARVDEIAAAAIDAMPLAPQALTPEHRKAIDAGIKALQGRPDHYGDNAKAVEQLRGILRGSK